MSYNARHQQAEAYSQAENSNAPLYAREINDASMDGRVSSRFSAIETDVARRKKMAVVEGECHGCHQKYDNRDYRFCPWCGQRKFCMSCVGMGRIKRKVQQKHDDGHVEEFDVEAECDRCVGTGREPT